MIEQGYGASTRSVTGEIIVAIVVALISIFLFLDVPLIAKLALILSLGTVGILNFAALVGWITKAKRKWDARGRDRAIRKFPALVADLYRLNRRLHKVLYERSGDHPSLSLQGSEAVQLLSKELGDIDSAAFEFAEKLEMMERTYAPTYVKINQGEYQKHTWKTQEFQEAISLVTLHLNAVAKIFKTVYREAELYDERGTVVPSKAETGWADFVKDYNSFLGEWKVFSEKVAQQIGGADATATEYAKELR